MEVCYDSHNNASEEPMDIDSFEISPVEEVSVAKQLLLQV